MSRLDNIIIKTKEPFDGSFVFIVKYQGPKSIVPKVQYINGSSISIPLKIILHFPSLLGVNFIDKTPNKIKKLKGSKFHKKFTAFSHIIKDFTK